MRSGSKEKILPEKIMVVEDEQLMRMIIRQILKQLGFIHVKEVFNGDQAVTELRRERYDLVVTDLNMPGLSGIELLKIIRNDSALYKIPVLVITADGGQDKIQEAVQAGAQGYIVKPFTAEAFEKKLAQIFPHLSRS